MSFETFLNTYYKDFNIKILDLQLISSTKPYTCLYTIQYNNKQYSNIYSDAYGYEHMNFIYIDKLISSINNK